MMHNNSGFGLKELIMYGALLFIALLFVVYNTETLTKEFKEINRKEVTYPMIENSLKEATLKYFNKYYKEEIGGGTITVTASNLIKYHLLDDNEMFTDQKDYCEGYSLIYRNRNNEIEVHPFIHCDSYETKGYQSWRLGE
ncbi:MAG: hypothetical protein HFJ02_06235 [Bacilli bacterium]|nr:hypothetical protein [Bacilli bacterium]